MKLIKSLLIILGLSTLISILYSLLNNKSVVDFINSLFIIGIMLLICGGFSFLFEKGFFKITAYPFKKIKSFFQNKQILDKESQDELPTFEEYMLQTIEHLPLTYSLFISGLFLTIFTIIVTS